MVGEQQTCYIFPRVHTQLEKRVCTADKYAKTVLKYVKRFKCTCRYKESLSIVNLQLHCVKQKLSASLHKSFPVTVQASLLPT